MGKQESKGKKQGKSKCHQNSVKKADDQSEDENDFGGLPKRDLKRNLGCG